MRILVAIAHHGSKNRAYLHRMLAAFREMDHTVDVVALVEEAKDLPDDVEQVVGAPTKNPWSLPFAHRPIFAERRDDYDLYVYSEDDTLIEQRHLDAFVELDDELPDELVPGFMRFEIEEDGARSYCTVHSYYRWDPASAFRLGDHVYARFTNDHSACYALTRAQLHRAIASGGFLVDPHEGRYDMLVSAATDVYTRCGMQKVLCVDRIEDQLVHHLPNVYLGRMGIGQAAFDSQLERLRDLADDAGSPEGLLTAETRMETRFWDRHSYPKLPGDLQLLVPQEPGRVLTVGATTGDLEAELLAAGHEVVAVAQDPVFQAILQQRGIETLGCSLPNGDELTSLGTFDLVLAVDVLPYLPDPAAALRRLRPLLGAGGRLVVTVPDHRRYALRNRVPGATRVELPEGFGSDGIHLATVRSLRHWLSDAGYDVRSLRHRAATRNEPVGEGRFRARLGGNTVLAIAAPSRRSRSVSA